MHKPTSTDDKRLQSTLKRLGVNTIPGIEEVNLFQTDGNVVHFVNPKGEADSLIDLSRLLCFACYAGAVHCIRPESREANASHSCTNSDVILYLLCSSSFNRRQHICCEWAFASPECVPFHLLLLLTFSDFSSLCWFPWGNRQSARIDFANYL